MRVLTKLFGKKKKKHLNEIPPGRYPVKCNPQFIKGLLNITICGEKFSYSGSPKVEKYRILFTYSQVKRQIISYGPMIIVVDANTTKDFRKIYPIAIEVKREDSNIPFTKHLFNKPAPPEEIYYDGYFIYLGANGRYHALWAPHLGSIKEIRKNRVTFENGRLTIMNDTITVK